MKYYLSLDVGGTEIKYNVLAADGTLQYETQTITTPMPKGSHFDWSKEEFIAGKEAFVETVENLLKGCKEQISGIAISLPGQLSSETGYIQLGGALAYMNQTNFYELFSHLDIPIVIDNDARCVAMAEQGAGNAIGLKHFACLTLGTGVGAGLVVNNHLIEGAHSRGGEYGASLIAVEPATGKHISYHQTCSMTSLIMRYCNAKGIDRATQKITGRDIFADINDPVTKAVIDEWYEAIAIAIFNLAVTFDCEKVLIGGGVSSRTDLVENIELAMKRVVKNSYVGEVWDLYNTPIETCKFRNSSGLVGAFYRFKQIHPEA